MQTVSFTCQSNTEADLIRLAVRRYGNFLQGEGVDLRNYLPAGPEGAGFGWDAVRRAAGDMHAGSVTHMPRRMLLCIDDALRPALGWAQSRTAVEILDRIDSLAH
ncbi:hypothetical protein ACH4F6_37975 [Streptomyces sp. NPDC017936]|uniref:hypothetical protein n=1 Tax=Streptomyces sp. NPDC017936 TaxID=3365016 RepID=UPI0037A45F11